MPQAADLVEAAIRAVAEAAKVCERVRRDTTGGESHAKDDRSPVTAADFASQVIVARSLADTGFVIVAEEEASDFKQADEAIRRRVCDVTGETEQNVAELLRAGGGEPAGTYWVLDPIDGTKGFLRGGQYAVALALIEDGKPTLGVLGCPKWDIGRIFVGVPGDGAYSCTVARPDYRQSITAVGQNEVVRLVESVESGHSNHDDSARIADAIGVTDEPLRMDSQAKYAAVACGEADLYLRLPTKAGYEEKVWDHAAGQAVVEAAGGRVTDLDGKPLDFTQGRTLSANRGIVASNGKALHDEALKAARR